MLLSHNGFVFRASYGAPKERFAKMYSLHPSDAVQGLGDFPASILQRKTVFVYTKTLLADAMKPLNVLSKFENHFAIRTVRFQVQLEADGYFSAQKFSSLQPQQAGRVGTNSRFLNLIFYKSSFKTLVGLRPNPIFSKKIALTMYPR